MPFHFGGRSPDPQPDISSFAKVFQPDGQLERASTLWGESDTEAMFGAPSPLYAQFIGGPARASYDQGLLRVLLPGAAPDLIAINRPDGWTAAWPDMTGLMTFAYDWLGRLHAVDTRGAWSTAGTVVRFSPGTGEVESATDKPSKLDAYLFDILPKNSRDWLSADYFEDWLAAGGRPLKPTEAVGYKIPLILGGEDDVPNLETTDFEVYLSLSGQLHSQTADLPEGTRIDAVRLQ
jgi:hypothetical protein